MKKLINHVDEVVPDMLAGAALGNPGIALLEGYTIALRVDADALRARGDVALISGGGSGHEPAHAGYVGAGMLTAAVAGEVFTSPSVDTVLAAIEAVAGPAGALLIVKNYTGDRLNFGLAAEIARSRGLAVEMVVVADDVALAASGDHAGRRGIAGTVLVHKIAGAAAARGLPLAAVKSAAQGAIDLVGTMGVALSSCTVPAAGRPGFELGAGDIELGLGIHGEPGVERLALAPAEVLVKRMLDAIIADRGILAGDRVALLVNNLGATPAMEIDIVNGNALRHLAARGIAVERAWRGAFLTALDMAGVSLSLMRVDDASLAALDAPTQAPAWPAAHAGCVAAQVAMRKPASPEAGLAATRRGDVTPVIASLGAIAAALEAAEPELTRLDSLVGDGDLGISLKRGAQAVRVDMPGYPADDIPATLRALSATLRRALGGTSGPLYAIGLLRAAALLDVSPGAAGAALKAAADGISATGGAVRGDGTMLDALLPAADAWLAAAETGASFTDALARALEAARSGTSATAAGIARRGRASYLGERSRGVPDPGAQAVVIWLQALHDHLAATPASKT
jgi:dihydroxyacetone kinase